MVDKNFGFGTQIRKSPYFDSTVRSGATGFSVYNHMYIPRDFGSPEQNFWNLINDAILCDVAVERQVEITGQDAFKFIQLLTPRDLSKLAIGQCKYVLIVNHEGGIINDPVLLRLNENHFWLSLADSDVLLWAQGVAVNSGLDVHINEPDVSPLQLQGPKSGMIMTKLFGESIQDLKYYWLRELDLDEIPLVVSRTGWSSELGYEIYLRDGSKGTELWEKIMEAGKEFNLKPGHTSSIRRIEGAMLSYHADADIKTNPFELGLDRLVSLDSDISFIGKESLRAIKQKGINRIQVGLELDCEPLKGPNTMHWPVKVGSQVIGKITSAVYSPRLEKNIALAMVDINHSQLANELDIEIDDMLIKGLVVQKPFFDPKKEITKKSL
ncbi:MAG: glycine cleavage T C-terminal barrel domain-containing protein [Pelagibacterales bacterium]|nr:glycine cleavage T C-terminal barrel domain-containing protein [Pelagibacterales bacterium]